MTENALPRVAVFGCGYWGKNLIRNFAELGALEAVSDADPARAAEFGSRHGVRALTAEAALADPAVDGVVIAAPAELHAGLAQRALRAGKHVFVEKPLALRLADAAETIAVARAAGRVLMVGHLLQYHPAFLALKDLVAAGRLGRLQYIYSNRLNLGKFRREENVFWSFAPHDLSMILALAGGLPDRVETVAARYLHGEVADVTTTHLAFADGLRAHVFVSWLHPFKEQKLVVVGDAGMAVFDDGQPWGSKLVLYPHKVVWQNGAPEPAKADAEPVALPEAEPLRLECRHFLDCMAEGRAPRTDGEEGLRVLQVLDAAERAARAGAAVSLSPAAAPPPPAAAPAGVHESAYVDDGVTIGEGTRVWHFSHLIRGTRIGRDCVIGQNVVIGPDVAIGDRCKIQNNVSLYKGVTLEDGVFCGPSCVFTNVNNPRAEIERKSEFRPTVVRRGATIGANATIVCGHTLGAYSFVAAGAVVTKDVPDFALVAGNPARRIGWMSRAGARLGPDLVCPQTNIRYRLVGPDTLQEIAQ
ncbi:MAG TPA: Gfo/Idh/MocA family oxidoreductase [Alphaproteobacteria bacterium]|nr:Gfo/Idh/MocA family oxidoreductase [Alphaproteobacteria bacterium]